MKGMHQNPQEVKGHVEPPTPSIFLTRSVTAKTNKQDRTGFAKMVIETDSKKPSVPAVNKSEYALFGK